MRNIDVLRKLAEKGRVFTVEEASDASGIKGDSLKKLLYRMEKRGWIERIEKGKYMIIPLEAEKGRYTLNEFVIASVLVKPYAIAYWSALHHHGLTEQIPSTVFIQTTGRKKKRDVEVFGVRYRIVRIKEDKFFGIGKMWSDDSEVLITDREKTMVDCLDKPRYCGGIVEVAKALKKGSFNAEKLAEYAVKMDNSGVVRRLGYLCELFGVDVELPRINTKNYLVLDTTMPKKGKKSAKWRLILNIEESELRGLE